MRNDRCRPARRFGASIRLALSTLLLTFVAACPEGDGLPVGVVDAGGEATGTGGASDAIVDTPGTDARSSPRACGGPTAVKCPAGQYCKLKLGECLKAGAVGECSGPPSVCLDYLQPVCGCDGRTYANECEAGESLVSVQAEGVCSKSATPPPTSPPGAT